MIICGLVDEDFVNYKKPSMFVAFPYCTFKCERECGVSCCQNSELANSAHHDVTAQELCMRYIENPLTSAVVLGGLEPMDSFLDVITFIKEFRSHSDDDIVIYTGYYSWELSAEIELLQKFPNIIVKFGRFVPNDEPVFDETLGIKLASRNQIAKKIS